ncbi:hypothetical protein [Myxococcus sp. RHSTA-1-4]|uniref:T4 family baseplate hub assembly chaperone n=1 Tax=Myxococcus sp. RHSTA-1-4 TaxID=2874601 RepID=UPI001CC1160F|nr:hypothetical protein [Myxococcus sp. RHSTA-1-4]MBZ4415586.1 hypothetical protein [Myxococcus sp. RHSTA-1-4]
MRALSASDIVHLWEVGQPQHPLDRALTLVGAACPELSRQELVALDVASRDSLLLRLRERTVGPLLDCYAECPACRTSLEFQVETERLLALLNTARSGRVLEADGVEVRYRLPDSRDLAAVARCPDAGAARQLLLRRCVLGASDSQGAFSADALPDGVVTALCARLEEEAGVADAQVDLRCPSCGHVLEVAIDITEFFWRELAVEARRLLREVHVLARAYCWSEESILAMGPQRRRFYLELAGE